MSHGHVRLAIDPPRGRVPGPHALAFLYAYPAESSTVRWPVYEVTAGWRVVDDIDETRPGHNVRDLAYLLAGLYDVAVDRIREGRFQPLTMMSDGADEMPPWAEFVGLGVSSLCSVGQDWPRIRMSAIAQEGLSELNLSAEWRIRLRDGTRIEAIRAPGQVQEIVRSTEPLDPPGRPAYGWTRLIETQPPAVGSADYWLAEFCRLINDNLRHTGGHRQR
jgi:hypothetical protein